MLLNFPNQVVGSLGLGFKANVSVASASLSVIFDSGTNKRSS